MAKPDIPKRLASKIRGAQFAVANARDTIHHNQQRINQSKARLDEFHADPAAFAARHYPRVVGGAKSYPVKTTIEREQEQYDYRVRRLPDRFAELDRLEDQLRTVEAEILAEVARLKPTQGRVPWPRALPSREANERRWWTNHDREMAELERHWQRERLRSAEFDRQEEERLVREQELEDARYIEETRQRRAAMTPQAVEAEKESIREFTSALRRGDFSVHDVIEHLRHKRRD